MPEKRCTDLFPLFIAVKSISTLKLIFRCNAQSWEK
jgi:hypothetical protein